MSEGGCSTCDQERAILFWEAQSFLTTPTRAGPEVAVEECREVSQLRQQTREVVCLFVNDAHRIVQVNNNNNSSFTGINNYISKRPYLIHWLTSVRVSPLKCRSARVIPDMQFESVASIEGARNISKKNDKFAPGLSRPESPLREWRR